MLSFMMAARVRGKRGEFRAGALYRSRISKQSCAMVHFVLDYGAVFAHTDSGVPGPGQTAAGRVPRMITRGGGEGSDPQDPHFSTDAASIFGGTIAEGGFHQELGLAEIPARPAGAQAERVHLRGKLLHFPACVLRHGQRFLPAGRPIVKTVPFSRWMFRKRLHRGNTPLFRIRRRRGRTRRFHPGSSWRAGTS